MLFLIPAAALIALVVSERGSRSHAHISGGVAEYQTPLGELALSLRAGMMPSPSLVSWAIAEAQALGRVDVAAALYHRFVSSSPASAATAPGVSPSSAQPSTPAATYGQPAQPAEVDAFGMPVAPGTQATQPNAQDTPAAMPAASSVSPLQGVPDAAWSAFTDKLGQDSPAFADARRVGRFHSSRARLAELGFDADSIIGDAQMQEHALASDLVDGLAQAESKGLTQAIGSEVEIPGGQRARVTLSGALGVLSVGGVRGLHGWLHSELDRRRFPHTTNTFLRTNGVF